MEIAESSEEKAVQVMLHVVADDVAELVQENLTNDGVALANFL
jgi:hypothetical protein